MILKPFRGKDTDIAELEALLATAPANAKAQIEQELWRVRAGNKGEKESAYFIDFDSGASKTRIVLHDLRFEINGRVAQIDHLMINRLLDVYVFETKHFNSGIKITEDGEFMRWNDYKETFEGMASPLAQNERHIQVLKEVFAQIDMPTRLGLRLPPSFQTLILVSPNARIDRPKKFDTSRVVKADVLGNTLKKDNEEASVFNAIGSVAKIVSLETLQDIGRQLLLRQSPIKINYAAKFGLSPTLPKAPVAVAPVVPVPAAAPASSSETPKCRACGSDKLAIQYGKYGYFFKCAACDGNTPIKLDCGVAGHKERLRKDGNRFYRECGECRTSGLFFQNNMQAS
jgi:hypothetical protein